MTDYRHNKDASSRPRHVRQDAGSEAAHGARPQQEPSQRAHRRQAHPQQAPQQGHHQRPRSPQAPQQGRPPASSRPAATARPSANRHPQAGFAAPGGSGSYAGASAGGARYGRDIVGKGGGGRKKKGGPWRVVFWVALVVFVVALIALGVIAFSYWQGQDKYNTVAAAAFEEPADIEATALSDVVIDWDALRAINPDTVGWVYVPGTMVNYPIVHTDNDDKYLHTDFLGEENWLASYGAIFLSAANTADFSDANNIVYGHHMNDGSMFAQFADFRDADTFNKHRTVYIFTPERNYKLSTFSLLVVNANDPLAQTSFSDAAELQTYLQDKAARSVVSPDPAASIEGIEKLFAFVTCADYSATNERIVLFAGVADSAVPANAADAPAEGDTGGAIDPDDAAAAEQAAEGAA